MLPFYGPFFGRMRENEAHSSLLGMVGGWDTLIYVPPSFPVRCVPASLCTSLRGPAGVYVDGAGGNNTSCPRVEEERGFSLGRGPPSP